MEVKRQLNVLEKNLQGKRYMIGDEYTIADICIWPWFGELVLGGVYGEAAATFLNAMQDYPNVVRWAEDVKSRPAVRRGRVINLPVSMGGLPNRHAASDLDSIDWQSKK